MTNSKEIVIITKENKEISFPYEKLYKYKGSETLKDLFSEADISESLQISYMTYEELKCFKEFLTAIEYSEYYIDDDSKPLYIHYKDHIKMLLKKYSLLNNFIQTNMKSIDEINKIFHISDYLNVKLLDQLCVLLSIDYINNDYTHENKRKNVNDIYGKYAQKYISYCENKVNEFDIKTIDEYIKLD